MGSITVLGGGSNWFANLVLRDLQDFRVNALRALMVDDPEGTIMKMTGAEILRLFLLWWA